jgi:hypothetical protein
MAFDTELANEALARLSIILPKKVPAFWANFRPPASPADLDDLRVRVAPYELPESLEAWLSFADGQRLDDRRAPSPFWWPTMECGPMMSAQRIADDYAVGIKDLGAPEGWLTISHSSHYRSSVELVRTRPAVLIDSCVSSEWRVVAPSLGATLWATAELAEAGFLDEHWPFSGATRAEQLERAPMEHARLARARELFEELGWNDYPIAPYAGLTTSDYLPEWGAPFHVND